MMKIIKIIITTLLIFLMIFSFSGCGNNEKNNETTQVASTISDSITAVGLWSTATYLDDTELGEGKNTVNLEVKAENKSVTFTVHTDKSTVGEALLDNKLVAGEDGEYGLYIKTVDGITADYDVDQTYWAFYIDGEYATTGVDSTNITESAKYQLVYTK